MRIKINEISRNQLEPTLLHHTFITVSVINLKKRTKTSLPFLPLESPRRIASGSQTIRQHQPQMPPNEKAMISQYPIELGKPYPPFPCVCCLLS